MFMETIKCRDCGVDVPRSGGRGRPRVRCNEHYAAFIAAAASAKVIDMTPKQETNTAAYQQPATDSEVQVVNR